MAKKVKVAIIGTNGLPAKYGGFETLTNYLTINLKDNFDFIVYCSKTSKANRLRTYNDAKLIYLPLRANGYQSVIFDIISILHAWFTVDKLLILGSSGALIFPFKVLFRKRIVLNIGGIDWGRSKWSFLVKKYIHFAEWLCVKFSDVVITDNKHIQKLYKQYYNCDSVLIEYGGDHTKKLDLDNDLFIKYPFLRNPYILNVSRAQSDNNIHMLIEAFIKIPYRNLVIISNWQTSDYGKEILIKNRNKYPNIHLVDAIYDIDELDRIRSNAWLYIHSHSFCGTAPSLVEAMNLKLPIICFYAETNIETTENKSLYFKNEEELLTILAGITEDKLDTIKKDLFEIASRRYKWNIISEKYYNCLK
jgi:glycosyltransferase involved in cell wall biosynthesis